MRASSRNTGSAATGSDADVHAELVAGKPRREPVDGAAGEVVELEHVQLGPKGARLDPAEVEEVRHDPIEARDLALDRVGAGRPAGLVEVAVRPERAGRGADRRERPAKVMRDGLEQRRLEGVALAHDLGRTSVVGEPVMGERLADLVGGGGHEPCDPSGPDCPARGSRVPRSSRA